LKGKGRERGQKMMKIHKKGNKKKADIKREDLDELVEEEEVEE